MNTFLPGMRDEERSGYLFSAERRKPTVVLLGKRIVGSVRGKVWNS